jgi:hypothetical protein
MKACSILALVVVLIGCGRQTAIQTPPASGPIASAPENWPRYSPDPSWKLGADQIRAEYITNGYTYQQNLQEYSTLGDFLNWGLTDQHQYRDIPGVMKLDENGVPMVAYDGKFYYNPVTVAQFSLTQYGMFLRGITPDLAKFWAGVNKILELQNADGSFPYDFDFWYYLNPDYFHAPWTSAMAQGQCLSVLARAWQLAGDRKYIEAGNRSFDFLRKRVIDGGDSDDLSSLDPSLSSYIFAEEYPAVPSSYTLNGFMFAVLGVYDWSQISPKSSYQRLAQVYFTQFVRTLDRILQYYEVGGWSAYDLGHITYHHSPLMFSNYHAIHIYELHALYSITNDSVLKDYEMLWRSYVPQ